MAAAGINLSVHILAVRLEQNTQISRSAWGPSAKSDGGLLLAVRGGAITIWEFGRWTSGQLELEYIIGNSQLAPGRL